MKESTALLWKEWRESRVYLLIGLAIFLGLPLIAAVEFTFHTNRKFEIDASDWVLYLGGVLAVFVAVGATCRDLTGRLEDFWRSRPVNVTHWMMVKYAVGLFVILTSCEVPLTIEILLNRDKYPAEYLAWYPFLWTALYSIGFLAGCSIRRTSHAATLALAGLLMVYLVPVIIPPLEWLSTSSLGSGYSRTGEWPGLWNYHQPIFALGMAGLAAICTVISVLSLRYDWHIQSGPKLMYCLISGALLLVFASAAFQLGTNLPILQQINLDTDEHIKKIRFDGTQGQILSWKGDQSHENVLHLRQFQIGESGIILEKPTSLDNNRWNNLLAYGFRIWEITKQVGCRIDYDYANQVNGSIDVKLILFNSTDGFELSEFHLWNVKDTQNEPTTYLYLWNNHVYIVGTRVVILDVSNPRAIKETSDRVRSVAEQSFAHAHPYPNQVYGQDKWSVLVPPLPDLPPERRLAEALHYFDWQADKKFLVSRWEDGSGLYSYQMTSYVKSLATFDLRSKYKPSLLERTFSTGGFRVVRMGDLLYREGQQEREFNASISVFDLKPRGAMPTVGHFAAPGVEYVCPLADGRAVVGGGNKIWLVGPPPRSAR